MDRRRPLLLALLALTPLAVPGSAPAQDAAAPRTSAAVEPAPPASGWHRGRVVVRIAAEGGAAQFRVGGGVWRPLGPHGTITLDADGVHTVEHRAVGADGAAGPARATTVRIDRTAPELAVRVARRSRAAVDLGATARDALAGAARLEVRTGDGRWRARRLDAALFDGTEASLREWRQAGAGRFDLTEDGTLRTVGGLGLLWFADRAFGDAAFRLQWREARPDGVPSNGGVFVRFPAPTPRAPQSCDLLLPLALFDDAWHAVACGHELQINDGDADPQRTGSVYAFRPLDADGAHRAPHGTWNDFEVRTTGGGAYEVTVVRNGRVLNRFVNARGQRPMPGTDLATLPRTIYPGTDAKQVAEGFFGLQNHGDTDTLEYRDVRVLPLGPRTDAVTVRRAARRRTVRLRAVDAAGNRSPVTTLRLAPRPGR